MSILWLGYVCAGKAYKMKICTRFDLSFSNRIKYRITGTWVLILKVFFRGLYGRLKECIQLSLYTLVMYYFGG